MQPPVWQRPQSAVPQHVLRHDNGNNVTRWTSDNGIDFAPVNTPPMYTASNIENDGINFGTGGITLELAPPSINLYSASTLYIVFTLSSKFTSRTSTFFLQQDGTILLSKQSEMIQNRYTAIKVTQCCDTKFVRERYECNQRKLSRSLHYGKHQWSQVRCRHWLYNDWLAFRKW